MTPERWQEIEAVLQGALDRPPGERDSFLDDACAGDEELKEEANSLITAYDEAGDFIEQPAIAQDARVLVGSDQDHKIGREIGPYRIIERLGAGGMGEVYLAQDARLNRLVALKILPRNLVFDNRGRAGFKGERGDGKGHRRNSGNLVSRNAVFSLKKKIIRIHRRRL